MKRWPCACARNAPGGTSILSDESVDYLSPRMERSWTAVGLVADQIERTRGRAETKASARAVLKALGMDAG